MDTVGDGQGLDTTRHAPAPGRHDVAIIGMACVMPGAAELEAFWANIVDGVDSITEVPPSRWSTEHHYDPDHNPGRHEPRDPRSVSKWGGWIPDVGFDALAWGIPPASLASIDPAQILALKVAGAALDDAGYSTHGDARPFDRDRASLVYATGSGGGTELPAGFMLRLLLRSHRTGPLPPELDAYLPQLTEDGLPGVLTSLISGRVANRLDLGGKNLTVDSACASALVALDIACTELTGGGSDLVLCGGVDLHNGVQDFVSFTAAGALSPTGRCRSFDADADGMTLAEGAGCIVLKRRTDAERDGDRIYAVVRGVAGSSDGRHLGLTAPRQEGQVKAVRRAYEAAGIAPEEVGLLEAHGTGTAAGDRTELSTMNQTFTEGGAAPGSVVIGSVKSNIGHIKCAAGIASLIKAAKATYHGVLPGTLHVNRPNEEWDPATSPFIFNHRSRAWTAHRRLVGVSGFGFGGTNFHAVLESHPTGPVDDRPATVDPVSGRPHWPAELFAFRAHDTTELAARLAVLAQRLDDELAEPRQADRTRLRDIAADAWADGDGPVRLAVVAHDLPDLAEKLRAAGTEQAVDGVYRRPPAGPPATPPDVAALPAGDATTRREAATDLLVAFPELRHPEVWATSPLARLPATLGLGPETIASALTGASGAAEPDQAERAATSATPDHAGTPSAVPATRRHGLIGLLHALAQLAVADVTVPVDALHAGRGSRPEAWADPGPRPGWVVNGHFARTAAGEPLPKGLRPADQAPTIHLADTPVADPSDASGGALTPQAQAQAAVANDYLRAVHEIMATGADILLAEIDARHASSPPDGTTPGPSHGTVNGSSR